MKKSAIVHGLTLLVATAACVQASEWPPEKQKESEFTARKLDTFQHGVKDEWGYAAPQRDTFLVLHPKQERSNAPLYVVLHSADPKNSAVDVEGAENEAASNLLKKTSEVDESTHLALSTWPLLAKQPVGESFHPLFNTGRQIAVQDGPWKLVATYGKTIRYALFNTEADPQGQTDLSAKLDQITFRLRDLLEQMEGLEYQAEMRKGPRRPIESYQIRRGVFVKRK